LWTLSTGEIGCSVAMIGAFNCAARGCAAAGSVARVKVPAVRAAPSTLACLTSRSACVSARASLRRNTRQFTAPARVQPPGSTASAAADVGEPGAAASASHASAIGDAAPAESVRGARFNWGPTPSQMSDESGGSEEQGEELFEDPRGAIIEAALRHVPRYGCVDESDELAACGCNPAPGRRGTLSCWPRRRECPAAPAAREPCAAVARASRVHFYLPTVPHLPHAAGGPLTRWRLAPPS
jgi:hypothetical protein